MSNKKERGLFGKYYVSRVDRKDRRGGPKENAGYFVLDFVHDPHAIAALVAYARACRKDSPLLAADIDKIVKEQEARYG